MPTDALNWTGQVLGGGRYRILAPLGEGGMSSVYRARDGNLNADVVIKVPRALLLTEPEFAARFAREVRLLVQLAHAHVVPVLDVGEHDGLPFAVLKYLAGGSLRSRQRRDPDDRPLPAPPADLRTWLPDVAEALDFIHRRQHLHRDVKPDNILFDAEGHVYLSDFGIAKVLAGRDQQRHTVMTQTGMVLGTAHYMAPELILGQSCDGAVDQYALAVTVYELLCGRTPFDGPTPTAVMMQQTTVQPRPLHEWVPGLPRALSAVVMKALAKDPRQRYPSCGAFAKALETANGNAPAPPTAPESPPRRAPPGTLREMRCPECGVVFRVPAQYAGQEVLCAYCRTVSRRPPPLAVPAALPPGRVPETTRDRQRPTATPPLAVAVPAAPSPVSRRSARGKAGRPPPTASRMGIVVLVVGLLLGLGVAGVTVVGVGFYLLTRPAATADLPDKSPPKSGSPGPPPIYEKKSY